MTDSLAHRGPDGYGLWREPGIGLGHRRLSIIDISEAAGQPMSNGRYCITYNGELYNYRELRQLLRQDGAAFRTRSDTEVVLEAYARWGTECVARFNGVFAMAVWDKEEKTLFLARDRYGAKPLYYGFFNGMLLFGSEQKALLAHPATRVNLDAGAMAEYFTFQNFFTDRTFIKGIKLFPAGSRVLIRPGDRHFGAGSLKPERYWSFTFSAPERAATPRDYEDEFLHLLDQAVERQLVSDVPVGSYLSGGLDSGAVTCLAARRLPGMPTFTCGFDLHSISGLELHFDERERAERMAYEFGTEGYEVVLKAGDMERVLPSLVHHLEEPRVGQSYPNYYIARLASKFVKVALCGAGSDELFGGYPWRYYRAINGGSANFFDNYYSFWQRLVPDELRPALLAPIWNEVRAEEPREIFRAVLEDMPMRPVTPEDYINLSLSFEAKTFLHSLLLVEDKLSMAHGLETRVPFLDNDLVDFALRLPVSARLNKLNESWREDENTPGPKSWNYYRHTGDGKVLLRSALSRILPEEVTTAAKQGFSAPDASWFRGRSMDYVRSLLLEGNPLIHNVLDRKIVSRMVMEHMDGTVNRRLFIWSLLCVEYYLQEHFNRGVAA